MKNEPNNTPIPSQSRVSYFERSGLVRRSNHPSRALYLKEHRRFRVLRSVLQSGLRADFSHLIYIYIYIYIHLRGPVDEKVSS